MRWNGLVDSAGGGEATATSAAGGGGGGALGDAAAVESDDWDIILRYGLRLSGVSAGGLATEIGGGGGGDAIFCSNSWLPTVGVEA